MYFIVPEKGKFTLYEEVGKLANFDSHTSLCKIIGRFETNEQAELFAAKVTRNA